MSNLRYLNLMSRLYNVPLMIADEKGQVIEQVLREHALSDASDPDAATVAEFAAAEARHDQQMQTISARRTDAGYLRTSDGVAILPVLGSLVQRGGSMDAMSGLTSYSRLASQLSAMEGDPLTRGVVLEVDSSGGEAAGVFELASQINAFSKPIYGVANYQALSAGYLLLSATHEVFMPETGLVGSVGVVMYHMDASKALEKRGISYTPIFAGARKVDFSPHSPLSEEARAWAQDSVNRTYGHFVSAVADYRGIDGEGIKATEAGLLHADQALAARFANNIGTLGDTVQAMTDRVWNRTTSFSFSGNRATAQSAQTDERVSSMKEVTTAAPTGAATQASTIPAVAVDASQAQLDAAKAEGAKLERERITGILSLTEAKDRPKLAQHFANSGMSVDVARSALAVAAPEVEQASAADKSAFARHMEKQNVVVGATVPGQQANADTSKVIARIDTAGVYRTRADVMKRAADGR